MDELTCQLCHRLSSEFTILDCDHVTCAECLWGQIKTKYGGANQMRCSCGRITTFANKSMRCSGKVTANGSPTQTPIRYQSVARKMRTEMSELSRAHQSIISRGRRHSIQSKSGKNSDLARQLDFLDIQFRRSLQQIQRNFHLVVDSLKKRYENLCTNIRLFWLEEVSGPDNLQVLNLSKLLERKYHKFLGHKMKNLNQNLLQSLTNIRVGEINYHKIEVPFALREDKENKSKVDNCRLQRQKILKTIQNLKEESKILKKVKKNAKYKFA